MEPAGSHGFGYDPVFYLPQYGQTLAQLSPETKNGISHRAAALARLRAHLAERGESPSVKG
jgi:XTP/dITP diphosphohydrolase